MDIKEFQKKVTIVFNEVPRIPGKKLHTKQSAMNHLTEEIGEVARQIVSEEHRVEKFDKDNLGEELADAMLYLALIAEMYNINLEEKVNHSIAKVENWVKKEGK